MRFVKFQKYGDFEDNGRKRAALARKQRLEREKLPLLSELIAEQQPTADAVMASRAEKWVLWQAEHRKQRADRWREARKRLFSHGDNTRRILRDLWRQSPYPGTPVYLLGMLHDYQVGRLDLENPPWVYRGSGLKDFDLTAIIARAQARRETAVR